MKYRELEYSRTFNLGDYQSERISLTVDLDEIEIAKHEKEIRSKLPLGSTARLSVNRAVEILRELKREERGEPIEEPDLEEAEESQQLKEFLTRYAKALKKIENLDESFRTLKATVFRLQSEGELLEDTKKAIENEKRGEEHAWDPNKSSWQQAEGARGPYERFPAPGQRAEATLDYQNMLKDIRDHGDRMTRGDFFYWVFTDGATVGRKQRRN